MTVTGILPFYSGILRIKTYFLADFTYFLFPIVKPSPHSLLHLPLSHFLDAADPMCVCVSVYTHITIIYVYGKYISVIYPLFYICDKLDNRPSKMNNTEEFNGSSL